MTKTDEWRAFLQKWSEEWLEVETDFPAEVREKKWLGFEPATELQSKVGACRYPVQMSLAQGGLRWMASGSGDVRLGNLLASSARIC